MAGVEAASKIFDRWLISEIRPFLAERGWRKRGSTFELAVAANTALIAFRRWKWNDTDTCRFFVEAGVFSPRLADFDAAAIEVPAPSKPSLDTGAISQRLSSLMGEHEDVFWSIRSPAMSYELDALGASVREKVERFVLPYVADHLTDEAIRDQMLVRLDRLGAHSLNRLRRLVEDLGPPERLADIDALLAPAAALVAGRRAQILTDMQQADDEDHAAADAAMRWLAGR